MVHGIPRPRHTTSTALARTVLATTTKQSRVIRCMAFEKLSARKHEIATLPDSLIQYSLSSLVSPPLTTAQFPKPGGFMSKAIRTTLSLVVSLVLFSALTMAEAGGHNADKDKNKEHHSRLAKVAFWRHHKHADKNAKQAQATQVPSKQAPAKTAQIKPASTKQAAGKKDQKQEQHASNMSKPPAKKAPAANKTKPRQKAQDPKTASLKQ